jgi:hypothetical protein
VNYTNTLQNVDLIVENIRTTFQDYEYVAVKMQLKFVIIWEARLWKMKVHRSYQTTVEIITQLY